MEVGTTAFADDVAETKCVNTLQQLKDEIVASNDEMERALHKRGMAQNCDKAVHIVCNVGRGSAETLRQLSAWCEEQGLGKVCSKEKYLGNIKEYNGACGSNVERRIKVAQECYHSVGGFWKRQGVNFVVKKMVYKGLVENTLLSGMEAELLNAKEIQRLDKWNVLHMRKVLGANNSVNVDGARHQMSNKDVRQKFTTHNVGSILRKRRLDWLRSILENGDENVQLRAAVFGDLGKVRRVNLGWNPWVLQWEKDLDVFAEQCNQVDAHSVNKLAKVRFVMPEYMGWFLQTIDTSSVLDKGEWKEDSELQVSDMVECGRLLESGELCDFVGTKQSVNLHRFWVHGEGRDKFTSFLINNECHWCGFVSKCGGNKGAKQHMLGVVKRGPGAVCPSSEYAKRRKYDFEVQPNKVVEYYCRACQRRIVGHDEVMKHVGTHVQLLTGRASKYGCDDDVIVMHGEQRHGMQGRADIPPRGGGVGANGEYGPDENGEGGPPEDAREGQSSGNGELEGGAGGGVSQSPRVNVGAASRLTQSVVLSPSRGASTTIASACPPEGELIF